MSSRLLKLVLLAGLGFGVLLALPISAADSADAAKIKQLIEKLGSGKFDEREQATKDLDAFGAPALEALRTATKSDDAEVSRAFERSGQADRKAHGEQNRAETDDNSSRLQGYAAE